MYSGPPEIFRLVLGPLQTNCYLLRCPETGAALVIDPAADPEKIEEVARAKDARIEQILLTHSHPDHLGGLEGLRKATGAKVLLHHLDTQLLRQYGRFFGLLPDQIPALLPDVELQGGEKLSFGQITGEILHSPGHSPGSLVLRVGDLLFTGDTLFAMGVGRVDLPGGSLDALIASLQTLFTYPEGCLVYPGHGPSTTVGTEKRENPYG